MLKYPNPHDLTTISATSLLTSFGRDRERLRDGADEMLCHLRAEYSHGTSSAPDNTRRPIIILVPLEDVAIWLHARQDEYSIGHGNRGWMYLCYWLAQGNLFDLNS